MNKTQGPYGIQVGQVYTPISCGFNQLTVKEIDTFALRKDIVVFDHALGKNRRIDSFKLAVTRHKLLS